MAKRSSKGKVSIPHYRWMMFWLLVLTSVALVCAIFGRVDVRTLLPKSEVKVVERTVEMKKESGEIPYNPLVKENEKLKENLEWYQKAYSESREEQLNTNCNQGEREPANATITYSDNGTGIQVQLPYNNTWRGEDCAIPIIEAFVTDDAVLALGFGRLASGHPIGAFLSTSFKALPPTSSTQLLNSLRADAQSRADAENIFNISSRAVNGIPVHHVEYTGNLSHTDTWYAAGRSYLFVITTEQSGVTDDEVTQIIQSLRVTK